MTSRRPCPPAPGPLEGYAAQFDDLFGSLAQRRGLPRLPAGPAAAARAQQDADRAGRRRAGRRGPAPRASSGCSGSCRSRPGTPSSSTTGGWTLLCQTRPPPPHARGVLVIDDTGDRKDGTATAHVGPAVSGLGGQDRQRHRRGDQPVGRRAGLLPAACRALHAGVAAARGDRRPGLPDQAAARGGAGRRRLARPGSPFRAVVADCVYGDNPGFDRCAWQAAGVPFVLALKPAQGHLGAGGGRPTPRRRPPGELGWRSPDAPGGWTPVPAASATATPRPGGRPTPSSAGWGPDRRLRLVVATTDPATLPGHSTWYLVTNLPRPARPRRRRRAAGRPGRGRAPVRAAELGRAGLQAGQRRAGLGRLPGPHRPRHPPPLARWSAAPSRSAGGPSSPRIPIVPPIQHHPTCPIHRPHGRPRGGPPRPGIHAEPAVGSSWPAALRAVRAWLTPWSVLQRCWRYWSPAPPPAPLRLLLDGLAAGRPLHLYLPP